MWGGPRRFPLPSLACNGPASLPPTVSRYRPSGWTVRFCPRWRGVFVEMFRFRNALHKVMQVLHIFWL